MEYKKYQTTPDINESIRSLREDGIFVVENFVDKLDIDEFYSEVLSLCRDRGENYEFGRSYRGGGLKDHEGLPTLYKYYSSPWISEVTEKFTSMGCSLDKIFATHDYISDGEMARNGFLHFDRQRCLKFFIYLNDVDETNGAFTCCIGSNSDGEILRKESWNTTTSQYEGVKNRPELDFPEMASKYKKTPVIENAGTLIVFDTDTFHMGGVLDEGKERLVVRSHKYISKNGE